MFNISNVETGQLFDWFVSGSSAFALIERNQSGLLLICGVSVLASGL